ncbi:MAG: hypothetical protein HY537_04190 [Deltaproteobacteria bacterium]|nr:hypothetical protein [Deltaproteobacteria bacterium]
MRTMLSLIILFSAAFLRAESVRCLGDGPKPLQAIAMPSEDAEFLSHSNCLREFVLWETGNMLAYRNCWSQLITHPLQTQKKPTIISETAFSPMSGVIESSESLLAGGLYTSDAWIWSKKDGVTHHLRIPGQAQRLIHLFWKDNFLYSAAYNVDAEGNKLVSFFQTDASRRHPTVTLIDSMELGPYIRFATGHAYPYVYFFRSFPSGHGVYKLWQLEYDVNTHKLTSESWFPDEKLPLPIESVHRLPSINSTAIILNDVCRNCNQARVLWVKESSCQYYDLGSSYPVFPQHNVPILARLQPKGGIDVIHLDTGKSHTFFGKYVLGNLSSSDLKFTSDLKTLYVGLNFSGISEKYVMKQNVPKFWE